MQRVYLVWTLLALLISCASPVSRVHLIDGGYENLVVAVSADAPVKIEENLIKSIQTVFSAASERLYRLTKKRAFLRNITILVPTKWTGDYVQAVFETFEDADVRIDIANPLYGDKPYTLQIGLCGERGKYIHITPDYLRHLDGMSKVFGDAGRQVVEEWTHYRYGILNENPGGRDPQYPVLQTKDLVVLPKACENRNVTDLFWDTNSHCLCGFGLDNLLYEHCRFIDIRLNELTAMKTLPSSKEVSKFCDTLDTTTHKHRTFRDFNSLCKGLTPWNLMLMNSDFVNKSDIIDVEHLNTIPTFHVVQQTADTVFLFVLDVSRSMNSENRITLLNEAVKRWLEFDLVFGNWVGVITFAHSSSVAIPIFQVSNINDKTQMMEALPNAVLETSGTCIGCALRKAIDILPKTKRSIIILVTDGEENTAPFLKDVLPEIIAANVKVVTLAVTDAADGHLEELASVTGGRSFSITNRFGAAALTLALDELSNYQLNSAETGIQIYAAEHVDNMDIYDGQFIIDSTIGNGTKINFLYNNRQDINDISIKGPLNVYVLKDGEDVFKLKLISYNFPVLEAGRYNYSVVMTNHSSDANVFVSVRSNSINETTKAIKARCWMEMRKHYYGLILAIYAEVKISYLPILNAIVIARIQRPNGASDVDLILTDKGDAAPDASSNDGIYSRYFTSFSGRGRYSVQIQVINNGKAVTQQLPLKTSKATPQQVCGIPISDASNYLPVEEFQRHSVCGSTYIEANLTEDTDILPPSPIRDLEIVDVSAETGDVTLKWTSPGDDLDEGTVSQYDLRMALRFETLYGSFAESDRINASAIPSSSAGERVIFTLKIRDFIFDNVYYFAIKAGDEANHWSDLSNIVQLFVPSKADSTADHTTISIVIIVIILAVILIIAFGICKYRYHRRIRNLV